MATLQIGNGNWAVEEDLLLGYNINDYNGKYYPRDIAWTRGSDAWRTTSSGLIQRAPWNLAQYSEQFENGIWSKTASSVISNSTIAPNGTLTADSFIEDTSTSLHIVGQTLGNTGGVYTVSVYAKPNGRNWMYISMAAALNYGAYFDVSNGVLGTVESNVSASITSVGNGWYRCVMTANTGALSPRCQMYTSPSNNVNSYLGNGTSGLFIWGAQIVEGSAALDYFPTTDRLNVGRVDYTYTSRGAMLVEPQRTNLCLYSQTFSDASWIALNSTRVSTNNVDPSGTNTALNVTWGTGGSKYFYRTQTGLTIGTTYTITFYVKSSNASKFRIYSESLGIISADFTTTSAFQRFQLTYTATATSGTFGLQSASDNTAADLIVAFAQFEAGAYPTTYVQTVATTVTRIADTFTRSNIFTNGYISSAGGTWYVELVNNIPYTRDAGNSNFFIGDAANNSPSNSLEIRNGGVANSRLDIGKRIGGTYTSLFTTTTSTVKIAIKWNGANVDVFVNGVKQVSASAFAITNMEFLYSQIQDVPRYVPWMTLYSTPLSDAECAFITTL